MMRLPLFEFRAPGTVAEAVRILDGEGPKAMPLAGGTDLLPNMKRRQQVPKTLMSLGHIEELQRVESSDSGSRLGACVTLSQIAAEPRFRKGLTALAQAASFVATPQIRNMATLGGNLCLDTRCNYYDQNYEWRKSIGFCLKKDGDICWVAPGSAKCMAVSSTDTAPALLALGARVRLVSRTGEREVPLSEFYQNDGIHYIKRQPSELLTDVLLDSSEGWRSTYWKLRRRGSFDFPVLSVAAAVLLSSKGIVVEARIVVGSVACLPLLAGEAARSLGGRPLDEESIAQAATLAARIAKPLDNTDFDMTWRKRVTAEFVTCALRELRGDDMRGERLLLTRHSSSL
ncbi:MAG: FAD binding domain-containing protein [Acidobacteria bacterium Pan2503]|uniref:FAD binding domain-containing protein n=1 Tax=Candidatus Acidiferrum panamense TaxID=2741543 RepID=A0A7V8NT01_9BACT|nr:FAD binding domain-containing protein [Candidatus Acidoferrum panamensis]